MRRRRTLGGRGATAPGRASDSGASIRYCATRELPAALGRFARAYRPAGSGAWRNGLMAESTISRVRSARVERETRETRIAVDLNVDGTGRAKVRTGIGFLNHLIDAIARHGLF